LLMALLIKDGEMVKVKAAIRASLLATNSIDSSVAPLNECSCTFLRRTWRGRSRCSWTVQSEPTIVCLDGRQPQTPLGCWMNSTSKLLSLKLYLPALRIITAWCHTSCWTTSHCRCSWVIWWVEYEREDRFEMFYAVAS
jgi:hypothetical protein